MRHIFIVTLVIAAAMWAVLTPVAAGTASAETSAASLDLQNVDVATALKALFKDTGKDYSIEPSAGVYGFVIPRVSFTNVPFERALKQILRPAGLTFRYEANRFIIARMPVVVRSVVNADEDKYIPYAVRRARARAAAREPKLESVGVPCSGDGSAPVFIGGGTRYSRYGITINGGYGQWDLYEGYGYDGYAVYNGYDRNDGYGGYYDDGYSLGRGISVYGGYPTPTVVIRPTPLRVISPRDLSRGRRR